MSLVQNKVYVRLKTWALFKGKHLFMGCSEGLVHSVCMVSKSVFGSFANRERRTLKMFLSRFACKQNECREPYKYSATSL